MSNILLLITVILVTITLLPIFVLIISAIVDGKSPTKIDDCRGGHDF